MYSRAPCFEYSLGFVQRWSVGIRVHRGLPINVIFYKWHIGTCIFMIVFLLQDIYFLNNAYGYIFFLRCTCRLIGGKSRSIQQSKHLLIPNTLNNIAVRLLFSILESPILRNTTLCLTVKVMAHFFHLTTYKIHMNEVTVLLGLGKYTFTHTRLFHKLVPFCSYIR